MILMSNGGAKERHDAVPHDLIDRPLVAVHGGHHVCQDRIEELPSLLGIALGQQFHGTLQVRKQHRHLLAFAFQRMARSEDFFGQVRRVCAIGGPAWTVGETSSGVADAEVDSGVRTASPNHTSIFPS